MYEELKEKPDPPGGSWSKRLIYYLWYNWIMAAWIAVQLVFLESFTSLEKYDYNGEWCNSEKESIVKLLFETCGLRTLKVSSVDLELPKHTGETVVLTGGSMGIGREVMKKLLQLDYRIVMGDINVEAGREAIKEIRRAGVLTGQVKCLKLDLQSLKSVKKFAEAVQEETNRIDLLINNAGVMFEPYDVTEDGYEKTFQVNYLGHFLLTHLLLPKIKETAAESRMYKNSTDDGSEVVMYASISPELEGGGGYYIRSKHVAKPTRVAEDIGLQKRLWDLSQRCVRQYT